MSLKSLSVYHTQLMGVAMLIIYPFLKLMG